MATPNIDLIQAVILTKNEEPNLPRVLEKLTWLDRVIIIDSFSDDKTQEIAASYPNVEFFQRAFDTHATQWNFGLAQVTSKYVLTLDADYVLTDDFIKETYELMAKDDKSAYESRFKFLVFGRELNGDNTMPRPVLFKISDCTYYDDGHTQRLQINGQTGSYKSFILHDDRKSLTRWLTNQAAYSQKEAVKLIAADPKNLPFSYRLRKNRIVAPFFVFFYCLFVKRLIFSGWAGWHYTLQRTMVEMLLALRLIEEEKLK